MFLHLDEVLTVTFPASGSGVPASAVQPCSPLSWHRTSPTDAPHSTFPLLRAPRFAHLVSTGRDPPAEAFGQEAEADLCPKYKQECVPCHSRSSARCKRSLQMVGAQPGGGQGGDRVCGME